VLTCGSTTLRTYLTPGGFGTPYVVPGSDQVLVPKHVEVVFPGSTEPVTTLDVPGFSSTQPSAVDCTYVDPQGLQVHVIGLLV
jgi:hypothetical protein